MLSAAAVLAVATVVAAQEPDKKADPPKEKDAPKTIKAPEGFVFHTNKDGLTVYLLPKARKGSSSSEGSVSKDGLTAKTQVTSFELTDGRELTVIVLQVRWPEAEGHEDRRPLRHGV
jgi:hypothetical protein